MASEPFRADVWFVHDSCTFVVWFDNMGVSQIGQAHVVCPRLEAGALIFSWLVKLRDASRNRQKVDVPSSASDRPYEVGRWVSG